MFLPAIRKRGCRSLPSVRRVRKGECQLAEVTPIRRPYCGLVEIRTSQTLIDAEGQAYSRGEQQIVAFKAIHGIGDVMVTGSDFPT